jgi:hypothetical protein
MVSSCAAGRAAGAGAARGRGAAGAALYSTLRSVGSSSLSLMARLPCTPPKRAMRKEWLASL